MRILFAGLVLFAVACREEPTIVIRFDPADQAGAPQGGDGGARAAAPGARDGGARVAVAVAHDGGAHDLGRAPAAGTECKVTADCVVEAEDCCDCSGGGKRHAVSKKHAEAKAAHQKRCKEVMCTMAMSVDPSCSQHAACVAGHCTLVSKK